MELETKEEKDERVNNNEILTTKIKDLTERVKALEK